MDASPDPALTLKTPLTIAVTGGIGAGKSTVARLLAGHGAFVIDSDELAREVVAPGTAGLAAVAAAFGESVLAADGSLDRAALGAVVFSDSAARRRLEHITHPRVRDLFVERLASADGNAVVVNDIPLIRSVADAARYHLVVAVGITDLQVRMDRLMARGHTEADARARIAAQISDDQRRALSDVWVDNSADSARLSEHCALLWQRVSAFASNRLAATPAMVSNPADVATQARADLVAARVTAAVGAEPTNLRLDGPTMQWSITVHGADGQVAERLADTGLPVDSAAAAHPIRGRLHRSADPGQSVNLWVQQRQ